MKNVSNRIASLIGRVRSKSRAGQPDEAVDDSRLRCLAQHTEAKDEKPYDDAAFGPRVCADLGSGLPYRLGRFDASLGAA